MFVGIGIWELLVLLLIGVLVAVIVSVVKASSSNSSNFNFDRITQLEEENFRLRKLLSLHGIQFDGDLPPKR